MLNVFGQNRRPFSMEIIRLVTILSIWLVSAHSLRDDTKMLADVIQSYERPTNVLAKVCWTNSDKRHLMAHLMKTKTITVSVISDHNDIKKFDPKDTMIFSDMNCENSETFLQQADDSRFYRRPYRWVIIAKTNEIDETPSLLTKLKQVVVDSEMIIAKKRGNDTFLLNLVYRIDSKSDLRKEEFGVWTLTEGFKLSETVAKTNMVIRRKDLQGKTIAASYVITDNSSRTTMDELKDLKTDNLSKLTHHNILPLFYFMNATKAMVFTDTWGYYINNTWNGVIGDIVQEEAELSGTLTFMGLERLGVLQYITQPVPIRPKFVFREPALSLHNNLFVLPFRGSVWCCIGGLVLLLILIIYINAKWEIAKDEEAMMKDSTLLKPNVSDIGIFVISAITQQGSINDLRGSLGRVVTFIMFLIFLFLYTSYSANIVALLQSSSNQIKTLTDLLNSKFELGVEDQKYNRHYFPAADDAVRKAIYENKIAKVGYKPNFMNLEEGVRRLRNKDAPFAFHMNVGMGYKVVEELFLEHEKCGLHEIAYYPNSVPWTYSKKMSPYSEIYKIGLARTMEHGLADRVNRIFYLRKPSCTFRGGSFTSVNMVDFHPVLLWVVYGMVISLMLLLGEVLMHRWNSKSH